jgi:hypothetical protein
MIRAGTRALLLLGSLRRARAQPADPPPPTARPQRRTHDMYEAVADKPLAVAALRVEPHGGGGEPAAGPLRTAQALLDRELQRVYDARSLREVHAALEEAVEHLRQLEVFRRIDALIDEGVGVMARAGAGGWCVRVGGCASCSIGGRHAQLL